MFPELIKQLELIKQDLIDQSNETTLPELKTTLLKDARAIQTAIFKLMVIDQKEW